ncbi:MAG: hypothetical protein E7384_02785 [Ruminococcaceae bacterium]|nr:hypothetical protein [Oscillospiraceae bacterium]
MTAKNIVDIILCAVTTAMGIVGLTFNSSIIKKGIRKEIFIYYTNLSNIAIVLFQLSLLVSYSATDSRLHKFLSVSWLRLSVAMMILLTFIVYHFVLRPGIKKNSAESLTAEKSIGNFCVHYAVPILTFIQWVIAADKESLRITDGLIWLICPAVYSIFVFTRSKMIDIKSKSTCKPLSDSEKVKYPYAFLNIDVLGSARVAANIAIVGVACALSGCFAALLAIILSA